MSRILFISVLAFQTQVFAQQHFDKHVADREIYKGQSTELRLAGGKISLDGTESSISYLRGIPNTEAAQHIVLVPGENHDYQFASVVGKVYGGTRSEKAVIAPQRGDLVGNANTLMLVFDKNNLQVVRPSNVLSLARIENIKKFDRSAENNVKCDNLPKSGLITQSKEGSVYNRLETKDGKKLLVVSFGWGLRTERVFIFPEGNCKPIPRGSTLPRPRAEAQGAPATT